MKIEINHLENISPPQNFFKSPEQTQHPEIIPTPPEKIPNNSESISTTPKNLNPSRKNLNLPEKLLLPKNSIAITETISNTRIKSEPLPEKSQPLMKILNSSSKNLNPLPPKHFFNPP